MFDWSYWLIRARKGDVFASKIMLHRVVDAVRSNTLTSAQREFLADALEKLAAANDETEKKKKVKAERAGLRALSPGRSAGKTSSLDSHEQRFQRARAVWGYAGDVRGKALTDACEAVMAQEGTLTAASDVRRYRDAYRKWAPTFREVAATERSV